MAWGGETVNPRQFRFRFLPWLCVNYKVLRPVMGGVEIVLVRSSWLPCASPSWWSLAMGARTRELCVVCFDFSPCALVLGSFMPPWNLWKPDCSLIPERLQRFWRLRGQTLCSHSCFWDPELDLFSFLGNEMFSVFKCPQNLSKACVSCR
jgi:hypothetical protein